MKNRGPKRRISIGNDGDVVRISASADVTVSEDVRATLVCIDPSGDTAIDVTLKSRSSLHVVCLATEAPLTLRSTLAAESSIHWHCITLGSGGISTLRSELIGEGARSDIDWIFSVRGSERQSVDVRNVFNARSGGGEITMKGVAEGKAHAGCSGMIEIGEAGQGTDTYLTEDVLMLDPTAKIDAVPGLEIRTNDVKASHSATVSRVTVEDLFYFQSRGITPVEARRMYIEGFLGDLTERIPDDTIRAEIREALTRS